MFLAISFLCLVVPTLLGGYWAWRDPGPASGLVPSQYQSVTQPRTPGESLGLTVDEESAMASQIFTNNIGVTFYAFAGGLLLGLGTLYVLLQNGVMLGVVAGLAIGAGNGQSFFELVTAHGVLELSCIIVAGSAGLRLGWSIIDPGNRTRGRSGAPRGARRDRDHPRHHAVARARRPGRRLRHAVGHRHRASVTAVGLSLGAIFWGLVLWRGDRPSREL